MALLLLSIVKVFLGCGWFMFVAEAKGKLTVGIIDYPSGKWRDLARAAVLSNNLMLRIKDFALEPPITIKHALEVERFVKAENVSVLIGRDVELIAKLATELSIPYLITEENHLLADITMFQEPETTLVMYPGPNAIKKLIGDIIASFGIADLFVIYDTETGHGLTGYLLAKFSIFLRSLEINAALTDDDLLAEMISFRNLGKTNIILLNHPSNVPKVLNTAMKLSLLTPVYHWIILTLDARVIDFTPWMDSGMNATMFQLSQGDKSNGMSLENSLLLDALSVVNKTVQYGADARLTRAATELKGMIEQVKVDGLTGPVEFDENGFRKNLVLDIMSLNENGTYKKGVWHEGGTTLQDRMKVHEKMTDDALYADDGGWPLGRATVRAVGVLEPPFLMLKKDYKGRTGNDRFVGYAIDLLTEIKKLVNFDYEIYVSPDEKYGAEDDDGNWDGMIRELMTGNASLAVGALMISSERESVVDFSKPFKSCDMNVLIARPKESSNLLQFLTPLHWTVWILIAVAVGVLSIVLTMIDKLNPNDEYDPELPRYTFGESFWFFYASLVQAGTEGTPQILSARILSSAWWFFSLIIISSYTANMAAFLTMSQISSPISGILSLRDQHEVSYGTRKNSRIADFFRKSNRETYKNMWLAMSAGNMVDNTDVAIEKVVQGSYAYIWDSPVNDYIATTDCRTMAVGGIFNTQGYGIGVPRGAKYRDDLTLAILRLNELGVLAKLDQKYWGTSRCADLDDAVADSDTAELEIQNVGGIFIILSCGALLSLIASGIQCCLRKRKEKSSNVHPKTPTIEDKWNELQERRLAASIECDNKRA